STSVFGTATIRVKDQQYQYIVNVSNINQSNQSATVNISFFRLPQTTIETQPSPSGGIPNIIGTIELTPDLENIAQAQFVVTTGRNCDLSIESQVTIYKKYGCSLQVQAVLLGEGCTMHEKTNSLGIDFYLMVQYSMLRYILSKLLYCKFSVQFLRRRYYSQFLKDLAASQFSAFVEYFTNTMYGV